MDPNVFNHVIVIYGRTDVMPDGNMQLAKEIKKLPNLTMDLIYFHDNSESVQVKNNNTHIIKREREIEGWFY